MEREAFLENIEDVEIQGATAVARETLRFAAEHGDEADAPARYIDTLRRDVLDLRPTEPMLDNAADIAVERIQDGEDADTVLTALVEHVEQVNEEIVDATVPELFENGEETVLTHCHSSTATRVITAGSERSDLSVYATETRPKYQGRTTATELVEHGVDTTLIVDSAVHSVLGDVDMVVLGADALTSQQVYNKIGTSQILFLAAEHNVPVYVAASLLKYTEETVTVEERDPAEVWADAPHGVTVFNPAFDAAPLEHVKGICTENGVIETGNVEREAARIKNAL
jgi:ribose 1,5-bisphosphate isomerase